MATGRVRIGVDVGGTFTDLVLLDEAGFSAVKKVLSTPPDYSEGIATGLASLLRENACAPGSVVQLVHATTVATNTVLELKGARTALLTTAGFRDILEMRRLRIPVLYDIQYEKPPPLVPRRLRVEVSERLNADGSVRVPLDVAAVLSAVQTFRRERVGAIAIGFLHSYINPRHEIEAEALLRHELGEEVYICRSSDILPEIREYERISTAVVNAYIAPVVKNYLLSLEARLRGIGVGCMIEIMNSAGGVMRFHSALRRPAYLVESGPAAGVVAAARIAVLASQDKVISFDKGGTTAKAAMIESGTPARTTEYEVGAGINLSSKLVKGSGYPIKLPFIDVSEIGAGGGSLIRIDEHGRVSVGPQSAGAVPGPVCYDRGGEQATLTDALVTLGYINPTALAGGSVALNSAKARSVMEAQIAKPLGKPLHEAAYGVLTLAVATMTRAVKAVSTYRGRDPREFVLHAFGGNGAVVACEIARALQMQRVLVPTSAGVFSAFGLLYADVVQEAMRTQIVRTERADLHQLGRTFDALESEVGSALREDGYAAERICVQRQADLRYAGQAYELSLPVNPGGVDLAALVAAFHAEHERTYGHRSDADPVEIVNLRVTGRVASTVQPAAPAAARPGTRMNERGVYFGPSLGLRRTAVGIRADLAGGPRQGPLIIEDYDSTCVVPPDWRAELDRFGNVAIGYSPELAMQIDPISFEVVRHALAAVADEMALIVMRSAYSPVVRDSMDYSTALCDEDGLIIAQGLTLAVQLGSFPDAMRVVLHDYAGKLEPGDVLIANDPYSAGGQHLPDIYIIKPLFFEGSLCGYAATMAHHSDVGGIAPGSVAIHAKEIFQEGLCLPMLKLYERGRPVEPIFRIIERNTRQPIQVIGDLKAQLAACAAGEKGLVALLEKFGRERLKSYLAALQDDAESRMRAAISKLRKGRFVNVDYIDGVGVDPQRLQIQVAVEIADDHIEIDFSGTSAQIDAAINCPIAMVNSSAYCAIRCIVQDDIPNCQGYMRPIKITAPAGTIVNPVRPAACAARGVIGYRVFDALMGALANVAPDRVIAGCEGGPSLFSLGGYVDGQPFVLTEVLVGTWGARAHRDGLDGISNPAANLSNQPVELIEATLPLMIRRYGLVADSGGPGEFRGGLAFVREYEFCALSTDFSLRSDRRKHPPYGIHGGSPGAPSSHRFLAANGTEEELPTMPMQSFLARKGDAFRLVSAGGGGSGDPLNRDPAAVLHDVLEERVSREAAKRDYGVILSKPGDAIDSRATQSLRDELRRARSRAAS